MSEPPSPRCKGLHQQVAFIKNAERKIVLGSGAVPGVLVTAYLR